MARLHMNQQLNRLIIQKSDKEGRIEDDEANKLVGFLFLCDREIAFKTLNCTHYKVYQFFNTFLIHNILGNGTRISIHPNTTIVSPQHSPNVAAQTTASIKSVFNEESEWCSAGKKHASVGFFFCLNPEILKNNKQSNMSNIFPPMD
jgi:hypothetical protein